MYGNFLAVTLFQPSKPALPFKTYEGLQLKLRSGECRLITSFGFFRDFEDFVLKLNASSFHPIQILPDVDALQLFELILNENQHNKCVVGMHYYTLFSFQSYKDCSLKLFDFNLQSVTYAIAVRKDFPYLNQLRLAFSFTSIPDAYDRLLKKYAGLIGNRTECEVMDFSGTPLGLQQLGDAFYILLLVSSAAAVVLIFECKWHFLKMRISLLTQISCQISNVELKGFRSVQ